MSKRPSQVGIALVGYGYAGATLHAPLIAASARTALRAIVTRQPERVTADWPDVDVTSDLGAVLADRRVDAVVVATPNATHLAIASAALEAGKHVIVDKPVVLSSADARALDAAATLRQRLVVPFHNRRWDGDFVAVAAVVAGGRLGRLTCFESRFDRFRPDVRDRWREREANGGGLLFDLGPHLVDQALVLFGPPATVSATIGRHRDGADADDYVLILLGYPGKEVILRATALSAIELPRFVVHGTSGSYAKHGLDRQEAQLKAGVRPGDEGWGGNASGTLRLPGPDGELVDEEVATPSGAYTAFYDACAAAFLEGEAPPVTLQDAAVGLRVLELARVSQAEGRRVPFTRA